MDMRVSTLPCVNGEKAVIRYLQQNPFLQLKTWDFLKRCPFTKPGYSSPKEIILTGPTGSKTSTLYTSLQAVARNTSMW